MNYREGSIITYTTFGGVETRTVEVEFREANIKNGRPGFDGVEVDPVTYEPKGGDGWGVWGYDSQITEVNRF